MHSRSDRQQLGPDDVTQADLAAMRGMVVCEVPYVLLVDQPAWYEEETVVGVPEGEWRALAAVNGILCVVVVSLRRT